ncbi:MAG TPA: PAS domain-containing sensor histidine kinase, partial [Sutterella sp.]|nr:PAS domain-containing sensor histidine kinase [Sutterella sp.]
TDVTQRYADQQLIHEQMLQSEKNSRLITMGEMASSLAHELNQPLTAIENYAFVVKGLMRHAGVPDEHEMVMSIDRIKAQAERAAGIISRVRAFTKRSEPKVEVVAIDTIINETWELALIQAKRYQAKLAHYVAPDVETVFCDPILIEQVLLNLIRNGMEAAFEVPHRIPEVTLTIYHDIAKNVIFEVADNGPGIPKELKSRLFDPFYSTKASGMGMGLNICRTIVELHHGRLTIEDNVHTGSIFRLMLPHKKETRDVAP